MSTPNGASLADKELVQRTRSGDKEAYGRLVTRYQGHVYALAYSLAGDWESAQDIAQEAFIRAYGNLDQLRDGDRFAAWLRRVTFSVAMNWLKAFRPHLFERLDGHVDLDFLNIPDFTPDPREASERRQLAKAVLGAIASLPPKYRVPLTMFHLDGLSYEKVADFLDIPLGTAKALIHRAREKLKEALATYTAQEVTPMVQEVLEEHKLPREFARKVLENVPEIGYDKAESTFCGSVVACMEFLEEPVAYDFVMGVSGSAFKLLWALPSGCPSNNSMGILGEEPIRRTFRALGRRYKIVPKSESPEGEQEFQRRIVESIDEGHPVIAWGIVGAPDEGIVAGYDQSGKVLLGRSYFYDGSKGYYEKADWYKDCCGLILIGDRQKPPQKLDIFLEALQWAIQLARTQDSAQLPTADPGRASGLAAYDAWAEALQRDEDFPEGDLKMLTFRCQTHKSVTLSGLCDARRAAVGFLKSMAEVDSAARPHLLAAVASYEKEIDILSEGMKQVAFCFDPEEKRLQMADPKVRHGLTKLLLEAKEEDAKAVENLEQALAVLPVS